MASTPKQQIASPQIFNSDPVEQIFAKGVLDPDMGGIAYAYLTAARGQRADDQSVYMQNLAASNRLAAELARQQMGQELLTEALKQGPDYAKAGINFSDIPLLAQLTASRTGALTGESPGLYRELLAADAAHKRAQAANAGAANADTVTAEVNTDPNGPGVVTYTAKTKGGIENAFRAADAAARYDAAQRAKGGAFYRQGRSELLNERKSVATNQRRALQNGQ